MSSLWPANRTADASTVASLNEFHHPGMMYLHQRLRGARVAIVTHEMGTTAATELREYLVPRTAGTLFVHHPLLYRGMGRGHRSYAHTYGDLARRRLVPAPGPIHFEPVAYAKDALLTILWAMQCRVCFDLFVGAGNLNAFCGLILRKLGVARRVAYYAYDHVPDRFTGAAMARIYRSVEAACIQRCDVTWNVSSAIIDARTRAGMGTRRPQLVVPLGAHVTRIPRLAEDQIERRRIVFLGNLLESQGLQLVLRALPIVQQRVPDVRVVVLGDGPYRKMLETLTRSLPIADRVEFRGYIADHRDLEQELANGGVAVATYSPEFAAFTKFADPGKIKNYLAAGLPVVMTDVPPIAASLKGQCAVVVPYEVDACAAALERLLLDDSMYFAMRQRAWEVVESYDWPAIFDKALAITLP